MENRMKPKLNLSRRNFILGSAGITVLGIGALSSGCNTTSKAKRTGTVGEIDNKIKLDRFENVFSVVDSHTEGEFCRIVIDGFEEPKGSSVMEKKKYMEDKHDNLRTSLMWEPRGHQNMFGAFLCEPSNKNADKGVIFMDAGGYLNMCGHCTIGSVTVLLETGMIESNEGKNTVVLESPSGLIETTAIVKNSKVESVTLQNVPSFVYKENLSALVDGVNINYDICFGGSFFAMVDVRTSGIKSMTKSNAQQTVEIGMHLKKIINETVQVQHPTLDIKTVDLVEFYGDPYDENADASNAVVFGDSQIDRSPCGTGTSAKLALLHKRGQIGVGEEFRNESILGGVFKGVIKETSKVGNFDAIVPMITGASYLTGYGNYLIDPTDPLKYGFDLYSE